MAVADAVVDAALTASMMKDAQQVVKDLYNDVLGRPPDTAGYIGWLIRIGAGDEIFSAFWDAAQGEINQRAARAPRARTKAAPPRARTKGK